MDNFWQYLQNLTDAQSIISLGFYFLLIIVFAETGLFFCFFLPGDYLLFMSGLMCSTGKFPVPIVTLIVAVIIAGILGNYTGYWFGRLRGNQLFKKDNSIFFKKQYMELAQDFYSKYGGMAIVLGRFFPIVRTFAPIFAGVVNLDLKKFTLYNFLGCIAWVNAFILSGYFLGQRFPQIKNYLEFVVLGLVVTTTIPLVIAYFRGKIHASENVK